MGVVIELLKTLFWVVIGWSLFWMTVDFLIKR